MISLIISTTAAALFAILYLYKQSDHVSLLKSITCPICIVSKSGIIVKVLNKRYASESPFRMNYVEKSNLLDCFLNDDDRASFIKDIESIIDCTEFKIKKIYRIKDSMGKQCTKVFSILYYSSNKVYVYINTLPVTENTEDKQVKMHIIEMFFDSINMPISVRDYSKRLEYTYWNKGAEELFGINRENIIGTDRSLFLDIDTEKTLDERALAIGEDVHEEMEIVSNHNAMKKDLTLKTTLYRLKSDQFNWLVTCYTNNSTETQQKEIINLLSEQFRLVTKQTNAVLWIWNISSGTLTVSSENRNYPNLSSFENAENKFVELIKDVDKPRFLSLMDSIRGNKSDNINAVFEYFKKNEDRYEWINVFGNVYKRDADGHATMMIGASVNINKQKALEAKIKKAERIIQQSNTSKSDLLNSISLVINNPLNSIIGYSQLLEEENDAAIRKEYVKNLQQDSASLLNKINILLQIANIQSGDATFIKQPVDLNGMMIETRGIAISRNTNDNVTFELDIPKMTTTLMLDNRYLMKVMDNLVTNAMRFTSKGTITIGYDIFPDKTIRVFVKDTGCGISDKKMETLFDKFSANTLQSKLDSGLGLPLCKAIIERLGGEIGVQSEVGKGSTFWFTISVGY